MIKVIINGAKGTMGQVLSKIITAEKDMEVVAGVDKNATEKESAYPIYKNLNDVSEECDVVIDFSHVSCLHEILAFSVEKKLPLIVATTGLSDENKNSIKECAKNIPILNSANMSLGVNALASVLKSISPILGEGFDIEIIEKHHNKKADAPSGTAYLLADAVNQALNNSKSYIYGREGNSAKRQENEIGIHAIRGGTIPGEHTVIFAGLDEVIEFKHTALSKNVFAAGAIRAARFITVAAPGLYSMKDIF